MAATYGTPTTKHSLPRIDGSSDISDVDQGIGDLADAVDAKMAAYGEGTLATMNASVATAGKLWRTTDTGQVFMGTGSSWIEIGVSPWVPGDLKATWLASAPAGWLLCDGAAVSRATYAALYAAIGDSAGAGNGTTTFNVPDARARSLIMPDGAAARMAANDTRGAAAGSSMLVAHDHTVSFIGYSVTAPGGLAIGGVVAEGAPGAGTTPTGDAGTGSPGTDTNMPPFLVVGGVLIKT